MSELLDELLNGQDPKEPFSTDGLRADLRKALAERVLNAEMDHRLASAAPAGAPGRMRVQPARLAGATCATATAPKQC
jgi:transposase-like protein